LILKGIYLTFGRDPGTNNTKLLYIQPESLFMKKITPTQASLVSSKPVTREIKVLSNGEPFKLRHAHKVIHILTVVDSRGRIVTLIHRFLSMLLHQVGISIAQGTVEQYGRTLSYLCRWIEESHQYPNLTVDETLLILDRQDIIFWAKAMKANGAESAKTLHSREACLKELLNWLTTIEAGQLRKVEHSPWGSEGQLGYISKVPNLSSPKSISVEVIIAILNSLHNECERCMFHMQFDSGLRISELINLTQGSLPDENLYDHSTEFIPLYIDGSKGRSGQIKPRITLMSRAVLKRIKRYHNTLAYKMATDWDISAPLKPAFLTANQRAWKYRNASKQFKEAVKRSNAPSEFRTHWMRHGTAFSILRSDAGKNFEDRMLVIQHMLGHSSLRTTEIYTQLSPVLLHNLNKTGIETNRLEEAEHIRKSTFLAPLKHKEKRGHRD